MSFNTIREAIVWAEEKKQKVKDLQDICLDHLNEDPEVVNILKNLINVQKEIESLATDCEDELKKY